MPPRISGYVPFYNNRATVLVALQSVADQNLALIEIFALDDGSTDGAQELVESNGFRCLQQPCNQGRGAARNRAMQEADGDFIVGCDATNVLPVDFVSQLLPWFDDPKVAAVTGCIRDPLPRGAVGRWRSRHLFKANHCMVVKHNASLGAGGCGILRKSAVLAVGNFNPLLRHSEDAELGERLLAAGYDIVYDPSATYICNVHNTLIQVLERYWRWNGGSEQTGWDISSWKSYLKNIVYSVKVMACQDITNKDLWATCISLICPHYGFWSPRIRKRGSQLNNT